MPGASSAFRKRRVLVRHATARRTISYEAAAASRNAEKARGARRLTIPCAPPSTSAAPVIRARAAEQSFASPHIHLRPRLWATYAVVPEPANGSTMISRFFVVRRMTRSKMIGASSFASRLLYLGCRTGGTSSQTSLRFRPLGFRYFL